MPPDDLPLVYHNLPFLMPCTHNQDKTPLPGTRRRMKIEPSHKFIVRRISMTRLGIAGFLHETNTFSPIPTTYESFASRNSMLSGIYIGEELYEFRKKHYNNSVTGFFSEAELLGHEIIPVIRIGEAEPSAPISEELFNQLMDKITNELSKRGPFDGLFLDLHGAFVYGNFQEGDFEILKRVRKVVGDIPIVGALDLHGNISQRSIDESSALVGYRTYPHLDIFETGQRCARLLDHMVKGNPLFKAFRQFPSLMPGSTMPTNHDPCQSLYAMIDEVEKDSLVKSASIMQGFISGDVPYMGPSVFTYAITQEAADQAADRILQKALSLESQFRDNLPNARQAVAQAIRLSASTKRPVILADGQDNAGGGSSSDTVLILEELVKQNAPESALALMFDPAAALAAHSAGAGADITLDLGGKLIPGHKPFHATFHVEKLNDGDFLGTGPMIKDMPVNLGKMAQLKVGNVRVVVCSYRTQCLDQSFMRQVGIEPEKMKILVIKSSNHYRADFEPISSTIINVEAPGGLINNPSHAAYRNLREGVRLQGLGQAYKRP
jgi:microcystin degradation protein MlrC